MLGNTLLFAAVLVATPLLPQTAPRKAQPDELSRTIAALDKSFFDAYNTCDLQTMENLIDENVEFYHDQTGKMIGRQKLLEVTKQNICGKTRRELTPDSLEVYPMKEFGAVQIGSHRFFTAEDSFRKPVGEAKFIHLWHNANGNWQLTRVISFDHRPLPK